MQHSGWATLLTCTTVVPRQLQRYQTTALNRDLRARGALFACYKLSLANRAQARGTPSCLHHAAQPRTHKKPTKVPTHRLRQPSTSQCNYPSCASKLCSPESQVDRWSQTRKQRYKQIDSVPSSSHRHCLGASAAQCMARLPAHIHHSSHCHTPAKQTRTHCLEPTYNSILATQSPCPQGLGT